MVERKTFPEFLPSRPQTTHSEKDTGTHENEDIQAVPSTRAENVCFSLAVKNEIEGTWNITRRSGGIGSIVCCSLVSYPSTFQVQIHTSTEKNDSTCVTQASNGPSIYTAHLREKICLRTVA
mgnify:CR=1 FL=1